MSDGLPEDFFKTPIVTKPGDGLIEIVERERREDEIEILPFRFWRRLDAPELFYAARVYYFKGNIYGPLAPMQGVDRNLYRSAVRKFMSENAALVQRDRAEPSYKTLLQLFDEQMGSCIPSS